MSTITITHTPEDGTVADGDPRPHQQVLKDNGFRWSRNVGWYIRGSRDRAPQRGRIERVAEGLRAHGFTVEVEIDDSVIDRAAAEERLNDRLDARQDALEAKADRKGAEAVELHQRARDMASIIPFGQPILVGHHSEGRDRNYRDKIHRTFGRAFETLDESQEAAAKAEASHAHQAHRENLGVIQRRAERLEVERRDIERKLAGKPCLTAAQKLKPTATIVDGKWHCPYCGNDVAVTDLIADNHFDRFNAPASGEFLARLLSRREQIDVDLAHWRSVVADREAAGEKVWGPSDFVKGDRVNGDCTVVRVNKKSLTVLHDVWAYCNNTTTLPYNEVVSVEKKETTA